MTVASGASPLRLRLSDCLKPLRGDLLWAMSRAGQELFHSNTLGFLMESYPDAMLPLRRLFEGSTAAGPVETWREYRNLDLVGRSASARYVVENKLYSIPNAQQLVRYLSKPLPWDEAPGPEGAPSTSYVLLSLMTPAFDPPVPWVVRTYTDVSVALDEIPAGDLDRDGELFERYRAMVHRLVALRDAVDPRLNRSEPFSVSGLLADPMLRWFLGPLQRMRYSGLLELVRDHYQPSNDFKVDLSNTRGLAEYLLSVDPHRSLGWQLQGDDLRLVVLFKEPGLLGKGPAAKAKRAAFAEQHWLEYFDFTELPQEVSALISPLGGTKPNAWNHYDPDFVYRYRRVASTVSSDDLALGLASLTERADQWMPR